MAIEIVELDDRVFEATVEPDTPGWQRRTLSIRLLSGPSPDDEEWQARADRPRLRRH